ncbi:MAG: hypothetical protein HY840_11545 [Bacteroidetes bacterium]|nr:hypothetical protein [Bacteroidota bacterium]
MSFIKNHILIITGAIAGSIAGYLYWQQVGCASGNCVITSNPVNSILYGMLMGGLLFSMFKKEKPKTT